MMEKEVVLSENQKQISSIRSLSMEVRNSLGDFRMTEATNPSLKVSAARQWHISWQLMIVVRVVQSPAKIFCVQALTVPFGGRKVRLKPKYKPGKAKHTGWI